MISIVIPAHNEAQTLGPCLDALLRDAAPGELEILVVCNGCTDGTAELAESYGSPVRVLESAERSKAAALNLGDQMARGFPRFYVDADVELTTGAVRAVAERLERGDTLAAAPRLVLDLGGCPWIVRAYMRVWMELPYVRSGLIGSGVYALSQKGRERFEQFPNLIADDLFVRNLFNSTERSCVESCTFTVRAPQTLRDLVNRKVRVFVGNQQLTGRRSDAGGDDEATGPGWWAAVRSRPSASLGLPIYLAVGLVAKLRAELRRRQGDFSTWDRDESRRKASA